MQKWYAAIDLKSFYASVECVERGLDPLQARLVVADFSRTEKTICLAVSPALKQLLGVGGRVRLYEVIQKARAKKIDFEAAPPRMHKYVEVSRQIYNLYTKFVAPEDIHIYSIDEVFIDMTSYLKLYHLSPKELAERMMREVFEVTGITATAGVGTNLYLAKIAMDILAKRAEPNAHGARIAVLDEMSYRKEMWSHKPLTDFWRIGPGISRRLMKLGIYTMGDLARYSLVGAEKLYHEFGVNAELIIDHAWGVEPTTMQDIKNYTSNNHSLSSGQVLMRPYERGEARLIVWEMADALALNLFEKHLVANQIELYVGFDKSNNNYNGETEIDFYGRVLPKSLHGIKNLGKYTNSGKLFCEKILEIYDGLKIDNLRLRRITIAANHVKQREIGEKLNVKNFQMDLFTDYDKTKQNDEKEARLNAAEVAIKKRYGKNAILKVANFEEGATMRERNNQVGGHRA